jgi:hypothetical protein
VVGGHPGGQLGDEAEEIDSLVGERDVRKMIIFFAETKNQKNKRINLRFEVEFGVEMKVWVSCWHRRGLMATQMGGVVLKLTASFLAFLKHSLGVRKD